MLCFAAKMKLKRQQRDEEMHITHGKYYCRPFLNRTHVYTHKNTHIHLSIQKHTHTDITHLYTHVHTQTHKCKHAHIHVCGIHTHTWSDFRKVLCSYTFVTLKESLLQVACAVHKLQLYHVPIELVANEQLQLRNGYLTVTRAWA